MVRDGLTQAFEPWRGHLQDIEHRLLDGEPPKQLPGYIDCGSASYVYQLPDAGLVGKLPRVGDKISDDREAAEKVEKYVAAYERGLGWEGLEQVHSYSTVRPAAVVCRYAGRLTFAGCSINQRNLITVDQFTELSIKKFKLLQRLGLATDPTSQNVMYDLRRGFTVIDYCCNVQKSTKVQTFQDKVLQFGLADSLLDGCNEKKLSLPNYALRYRRVCRDYVGRKVAQAITRNWRENGWVVADVA